MKIIFEATEAEMLALVNSCLCSGLPILATSGVELDYSRADYDAAKKNLAAYNPKEIICIEDVQTEILRMGNSLTFTDTENDESVDLNLSLIKENWSKLRTKDVLDYINENDDAQTSENLMQTLLYGEVVFG